MHRSDNGTNFKLHYFMKLSFIFGLIASCAFAGAIQQVYSNTNESFFMAFTGIVFSLLFLRASNYKPLS